MGVEAFQGWDKTLASALEWWRDAGVDMLAEDTPRDWLARAAEPAPARAAVPAPAAPIEIPLPDTLDAFVAWRMGEDAPEAAWHTPRIAPTGPADAPLVVLTDMPEAEDRETLLSGPAGALFDAMLAAVGLDRSRVYLASIATARSPIGRIPPEDAPRLIELMRHQLGILSPKSLLLLGQAASRAVPETSDGIAGHSIDDVNHFGRQCRVVATFPPRFLLERPVAKSEAWKHLLQLSRGWTE